MTTRFQVPTALHNQLEQRAKEVGLSVEDAVVQAITLWLAEAAKARMAALAMRALVEPEALPGSTDIDKLLAKGFPQEAAVKPEPPVEAWRTSGEGWDGYAEP